MITLCTICSAAFAGTLAPTAHQLAYVVIARETYHKTPIELSYSISSAVAGLLVGPVILTPLVGVVGRSSVIFWSLLAVIACQIWAALMTSKDEYLAFVISRLVAGVFGAMPAILGPSFIMETTFLHQRGKAFLTYELSVLLGVTAGPTIGGIIVNTHPWPVTFWWTIGPLAIAALLVFLFLEESGFDREHKESGNPERPGDLVPNRLATFFPGNHAVRPMGGPHLVSKSCSRLSLGPNLMIVATLCSSIHCRDLTHGSDRRVLRVPNFRLHHRAQCTASNIPTKPSVYRRLWLLPTSKCQL